MSASCTRHKDRETSWASGLLLCTNKGEELSSRLKAECAVPRACSGVLLSHKVTFSFPGRMVSRAESRKKQMGR